MLTDEKIGVHQSEILCYEQAQELQEERSDGPCTSKGWNNKTSKNTGVEAKITEDLPTGCKVL